VVWRELEQTHDDPGVPTPNSISLELCRLLRGTPAFECVRERTLNGLRIPRPRSWCLTAGLWRSPLGFVLPSNILYLSPFYGLWIARVLLSFSVPCCRLQAGSLAGPKYSVLDSCTETPTPVLCRLAFTYSSRHHSLPGSLTEPSSLFSPSPSQTSTLQIPMFDRQCIGNPR
jgi:hypothetical protein